MPGNSLPETRNAHGHAGRMGIAILNAELAEVFAKERRGCGLCDLCVDLGVLCV